jgi:hypothetical protein
MKILTGSLLLTLACSASAHHSPAGYAQGVELVLEGTIAEYEWANPHVYIHLDVRSAEGTDRWHVEANPPTILRREGWTAMSIARGEAITVTVTPAIDRSRHLGFAHTVTKADGTELVNFDPDRFSRPADEAEPEPEPDTGPASTTDTLTGTWLSEPGPELSAALGVIGLPQAELTAAGLGALEAFDEEAMHPGLDCTQFPPPIYMAIPAIISVEMGDEATMIRSDFEGVERFELDPDDTSRTYSFELNDPD